MRQCSIIINSFLAVMLIGMGEPNISFPISAAAFREVDIIGVFRYCNTYLRAIEILRKKEIRSLKKLITHTFEGLRYGADALDLASKPKDNGGKLIVKVVVKAIEEDFPTANTGLYLASTNGPDQ